MHASSHHDRAPRARTRDQRAGRTRSDTARKARGRRHDRRRGRREPREPHASDRDLVPGQALGAGRRAAPAAPSARPHRARPLRLASVLRLPGIAPREPRVRRRRPGLHGCHARGVRCRAAHPEHRRPRARSVVRRSASCTTPPVRSGRGPGTCEAPRRDSSGTPSVASPSSRRRRWTRPSRRSSGWRPR